MLQFKTDVTAADVDRMTGKLYITGGSDRSRKWSAFWVLLILSAIIATAGVVGDSTATVIGAMIVAPLMTPILGTALALVLADRRHVSINMIIVLTGAATVIGISYAFGLLHPGDIVAATNDQVAGRVNPNMVDLLAALATGVVGAFALVRSDISDTLPGVAIAISLVPPLAVVGLTLESGAPQESLGALLLFATNVAAIIATGTAVLLAYRIREITEQAGHPVGRFTRLTAVAVIAVVALVSIPLGLGSWTVYQQQHVLAAAQPVAADWAAQQGWFVKDLTYQQDTLAIVALGPPPQADAGSLRADLNAAGLSEVPVSVTLVIGGTRQLPAAP